VPIVIQSRGVDETVWISEVRRRNRVHAVLTARAKAQITGRIYRLVDEQGVELEQVEHLPRFGSSGSEPASQVDGSVIE
jgi:hypothetical protein